MTAYVIAEIEVTDPERYEGYKKAVGPVLEKFGAKVLARGGEVEVFEGELSGRRVVILEFDSLDQARRWHRSAEYAGPKAIRLLSSRATLYAVEGV